MPDVTQTISFRVPASIAKQLEEAGAIERLSRNEYARDLVLKALNSPSLHAVVAELHELKEATRGLARATNGDSATLGSLRDISQQGDELKSSIDQLAESLAMGVTGLLSAAGNLDVEQAQAWVAQYLRTPHGRV
jgi:precorrin-4 methylase